MSKFNCKTCLEKFKWSDILHNFLSIGKIPLVCKKCGQEYYITFTSKLIFAVLVAIPLFGAKFLL